MLLPEVESSKTSLASRTSSRTHFEVLGLGLEGQVLGLGLEASSPRKLACWPVLGSRTELIFELLKFCGALEKFFRKRFFVVIAWKIFVKTFFFFWRSPEKFLWRPFFFFGEHLRLCPWSLALASSIPVLGLESVCPQKGCPWPWPWIFLCPWPWPRALCPRLHLWLLLWIHCLSYSRVKNNRNRRNAKSKKKLISVLIQNKRAWITSRV